VKLPGTDGTLHEMLPQGADQTTVFCFLGTECPLAKLYAPRLQRLADEYAAHSVRFVGVCSNLQDGLEKLREYGSTHEIGFPLVKDYDHRLADLLGAERTPEVIVVDARGIVRYRGRIDDQYRPGAARDKPRQTDLATALAELTSGKEVTTPRTDAVGCLIGRAFEGEVTTSLTYCKDISRLMQKHCVECHRPRRSGLSR
jgi:peroxiredoxin